MIHFSDALVSLGLEMFGSEGVSISGTFDKTYDITYSIVPHPFTDDSAIDAFEWTTKKPLDEVKNELLDYIQRPLRGLKGFSLSVSDQLEDVHYAYISLVVKLMVYPLTKNWAPSRTLEYIVRYNGMTYSVSLEYNKIQTNASSEVKRNIYINPHMNKDTQKNNSNENLKQSYVYKREKTFMSDAEFNIYLREMLKMRLVKVVSLSVVGFMMFSFILSSVLYNKLNTMKPVRFEPIVHSQNFAAIQEKLFAELHLRKYGELPENFAGSTGYSDLSDQSLIQRLDEIRKIRSEMGAYLKHIESTHTMETPLEISRKIDVANQMLAHSSEEEFKKYLEWMTLEELQLYLDILKENSNVN